jgi:hypothetical protein
MRSYRKITKPQRIRRCHRFSRYQKPKKIPRLYGSEVGDNAGVNTVQNPDVEVELMQTILPMIEEQIRNIENDTEERRILICTVNGIRLGLVGQELADYVRNCMDNHRTNRFSRVQERRDDPPLVNLSYNGYTDTDTDTDTDTINDYGDIELMQEMLPVINQTIQQMPENTLERRILVCSMIGIGLGLVGQELAEYVTNCVQQEQQI